MNPSKTISGARALRRAEISDARKTVKQAEDAYAFAHGEFSRAEGRHEGLRAACPAARKQACALFIEAESLSDEAAARAVRDLGRELQVKEKRADAATCETGNHVGKLRLELNAAKEALRAALTSRRLEKRQ